MPSNTATDKREARKISSNHKSAAFRVYFSERENLTIFNIGQPCDFLPPIKILTNEREVQHHCRLQSVTDASCTDKLILLVQANPVLYDKSAAVKDALKKGDIWQIDVEIDINSKRSVTRPYTTTSFPSAWF